MALIKCPECGAQISDKAKECPKCGLPQSEFYKKEFIVCPECGERIDATVTECPNCACPVEKFGEIKSVESVSNATEVDGQQEKGKIIVIAAPPTVLLSHVSIKIDGELVGEFSEATTLEIPIEKDCEVKFKWRNTFLPTSIMAKANEIKEVYVDYGAMNLTFDERVIKRLDFKSEPVRQIADSPIANSYVNQTTTESQQEDATQGPIYDDNYYMNQPKSVTWFRRFQYGVSVLLCFWLMHFFYVRSCSSSSTSVHMTNAHQDAKYCADLVDSANTLKELDEAIDIINEYLELYTNAMYNGKISHNEFERFVYEYPGQKTVDDTKAYIIEFGHSVKAGSNNRD